MMMMTLKLNFWKYLTNLEKALCFLRGEFVSDKKSEIVSVLSEPSSVVAHKEPFWCFKMWCRFFSLYCRIFRCLRLRNSCNLWQSTQGDSIAAMCPSHFCRVRLESESRAIRVRVESESRALRVRVESESSKIFSSQSRVMTWSSRVRVESQEWSRHFESLVYKLESMSSHTNFKLFLYIFGYRSSMDLQWL